MPIPIETIARLVASQSDLIELGELSADGKTRIEMAMMRVLDKSETIVIGYHLVINAQGTCEQLENLATLVSEFNGQ